MVRSNQPSTSGLTFLAGGGELGERIRAFDWTRTPLGPPESWPQSLKTSVRIMLTSRQPIWIGWGNELTYLYNDPYKAIIGGKHPRMLGQPTAVVWSEIWDDIAPLLAKAMQGDEGTYVEEQLLIMERSGYPEETYYTFSYTPIPDDSGAAGGIICANTDDTKRVIGERQLAMLRDLASATADLRNWRQVCERGAAALSTNPRDIPFAMVYMVEADGRAATLSGATGIDAGHAAAQASIRLDGGSPWPLAQALSQHAPQLVDGIGAKFGALPTGAWRTAPDRAVVLPIVSGQPARLGLLIVGLNPFRLVDGEYLGFLSLAAGQIGAAVAVADAYEQERRRADTLAELDRAKTTFFSNVSHELRTPLTLMLGPLQDALANAHGVLPKGAAADLTMAQRNALRLLKLVNTLLDFSRIEAGRVKASYEPTDLSSFTAELASSFRSAVDKAGMRLVVDCPPLAAPVFVDREMWEKVVLNLLSNAFKYTLRGEIRVAMRPAGDHAELVVSDTGTGIPEEAMPRLFERFFRVEGAMGRTHEGTGIGLALVAELVRLHGGSVRAESRLGAGSTFTVSLPLGRAHLPDDRIQAQSRDRAGAGRATFLDEAESWLVADTPEAAELPTGTTARVSSLATIVLADDNVDMRGYIERVLSPRYRIVAVGNGEDALEAVKSEKPGLVLTDVMMPRLDGFGLLRRLRQNPETAAMPVIMLSARAGEEAKIEGLQRGVDDYIVKPFSARELVARVDAQFELSRFRREAEQAARARETELLEAQGLAHVGSWHWDAQTDVTTGSTELYRIYGLDPAGSFPDFRDQEGTLYPGESWNRIEEAVQETMRTGVGYEFDVQALRAGKPIWITTRGAPVRDAKGRIVGLRGTVQDITERKLAEQALSRRTAQVQALIDQAPMGVYLVDADFRIRDVNPVALPVFGNIPGGVVGRDFGEIIHILWARDYADEVVRIFRRTLETGEPYNVAERAAFRADRGITEYYEWRIDRIPLPDGRHGVVCYFRDISQHVEARLRIAESEERFRRLVSVITDVPWTADAAGHFAAAQPEWESYTGQTPEQYRGLGWTDALHAEDRDSVLDAWSAARGSRTLFVARGRLWCEPKRQYRHFEARATPLVGPDGSVREWVGSCTDIEDRVRARSGLVQTQFDGRE